MQSTTTLAVPRRVCWSLTMAVAVEPGPALCGGRAVSVMWMIVSAWIYNETQINKKWGRVHGPRNGNRKKNSTT